MARAGFTMTWRPRLRPPWPLLVVLTASGWTAMLATVQTANLPRFCGSTAWGVLASTKGIEALEWLLILNPPDRLLIDWLIMLAAMMPPLLAPPISHVQSSVGAPLRAVGPLAFLIGYAAIWTTAGPLLLGLGLSVSMSGGNSALPGTLVLALLWSASPWHRIALNRSHRLPRLARFGPTALGDSLRFGLHHAGWCLLTSWHWMLLPLVAGTWHAPVMLLAMLAMLADRLSQLSYPRWSWPQILVLSTRLANAPASKLTVRLRPEADA